MKLALKVFSGIAATAFLGMFLACGGAKVARTAPPASKANESQAASEATAQTPKQPTPKEGIVNVAISDQTEDNPVNAEAEISFDGVAHAVLAKDSAGNSIVERNFGTKPIGQQYALKISPEGSGGPVHEVPILLTDEYNWNGGHQTRTNVEFDDDRVIVNGLAVKAATGKFEFTFDRTFRAPPDELVGDSYKAVVGFVLATSQSRTPGNVLELAGDDPDLRERLIAEGNAARVAEGAELTVIRVKRDDPFVPYAVVDVRQPDGSNLAGARIPLAYLDKPDLTTKTGDGPSAEAQAKAIDAVVGTSYRVRTELLLATSEDGMPGLTIGLGAKSRELVARLILEGSVGMLNEGAELTVISAKRNDAWLDYAVVEVRQPDGTVLPAACIPLAYLDRADFVAKIGDDVVAKSRWIGTTYGTTISHVEGDRWAEVDNATGKQKWELTQTGEGPGYVELFNADRNQTWRMHDDRMMLLKDGKWEWIANGHWEADMSADDATGPQTIPMPAVGYGDGFDSYGVPIDNYDLPVNGKDQPAGQANRRVEWMRLDDGATFYRLPGNAWAVSYNGLATIGGSYSQVGEGVDYVELQPTSDQQPPDPYTDAAEVRDLPKLRIYDWHIEALEGTTWVKTGEGFWWDQRDTAQAKQMLADRAAGFRTWSDASGDFSVKAKFVRFQNRKVTLEKQDGSTVDVPLAKLCPTDRQFATQEHEKQKAAK